MNAFKPPSPPPGGGAAGVGEMADYVTVWLPRWWTSVHDKELLRRLEEELLLSGVLLEIKERTEFSAYAEFIVDALAWTCDDKGTNVCPAIIIDADAGKAYVVKIDTSKEKFTDIIDLTEYVVNYIKGLDRYSECIARYGYDYC
jgi:hypothetical protein